MQALAELNEYLVYMRELGFEGLAVEEDLFEMAVPPPPPRPAPAPVRPDAVHRPQAARPPAPSPKPKPAPRQPKPAGVPNLSSIMNMVSEVAPVQDTRRMAAEVRGRDQVEILKGLYSVFDKCQACALGTTRDRFVFGIGPPNPPVMFIGTAPGKQENSSGTPFVDEAGQLLDKIITSMGLSREQVFLSNMVKCHPPENREPLPDEIQSCAPLLARQIEAVNPRIIVALGSAITFFKGPEVSVQRNRGQMFSWRNRQVMPTYDPAYILRNPRCKREVWHDVKRVMNFLNQM